MLSRPRRLTYANVMSTIAVFLALSMGTAYAANTVFSSDIVDGEVHSADIGNFAVTNGKLGPNAIGGGKVADNTLTGADVKEATLGEVPLALVAGTGRSAVQSAPCNPNGVDQMPNVCVNVQMNLPTRSRVLVTGRVQAISNSQSTAYGDCALATSRTGELGETYGELWLPSGGGEYVPLVAVTPPLDPGPVLFDLQCAEGGRGGDLYYEHAQITAVAISPN